MLGISISPRIGIGDGLQFSSLPENYYKTTGKALVDVSKPWFFDNNPYVHRGIEPNKTIEMWNFGHHMKYQWPKPRPEVYLSNAEIHAAVLGAKVFLNRPRLYKFEDVPYAERDRILFHPRGISHGRMPLPVIDHVINKYGPNLYVIGAVEDPTYGLPRLITNTLWELAEAISRARMFIGVDSGPGWIAACYPDVVLKIVRTKPSADVLQTWVPLHNGNIHSHWDDRCRSVYNTTDHDIGFTYSYRRL